jgi:hypothetical protein
MSPTSTPDVREPTNELAFASMLVGAVAMVLACIPFFGWWFSWIPAIVAIVFASIGLRTARRTGVRAGIAWTGLSLGVGSLIPIAGYFAFLWVFANFSER